MTCWPRYLLWLVITIFGVGNLISACGQKGPLYLPEPEQPQETEKSEPAG
jgi:predicted small lipoprotein YifL